MIFDLIQKIKRKWMKMRLQPIRVFCFHHVSEQFDESNMYRIDWLQIDDFKNLIRNYQQEGYIFIPLADAFNKLKHDRFRSKKYAVLTADDGWATLRNVLPWLNELKIPITLFLNPAYLDGKHYREKVTEEYLTEDEVKKLHVLYPLLTIGMHGWEHKDATMQTEKEFEDSLLKSIDYFSKYPNYIPFFAYTYGRYNDRIFEITNRHKVVPLLIRGNKNYSFSGSIDRELLGFKR